MIHKPQKKKKIKKKKKKKKSQNELCIHSTCTFCKFLQPYVAHYMELNLIQTFHHINNYADKSCSQLMSHDTACLLAPMSLSALSSTAKSSPNTQ